MTTSFPIPILRTGGSDYITKYSLDQLKNEIVFKCGKYTIKRQETTETVYKISVNIYDIPITEANIIKSFYEEKHQSEHFTLELDNIEYNSIFTSFKIESSNLFNRKNITFSVIGSL